MATSTQQSASEGVGATPTDGDGNEEMRPDPKAFLLTEEQVQGLLKHGATGIDSLKDLIATEGLTAGIVDKFIARVLCYFAFGHQAGCLGVFCTEGSIFGKHKLAPSRYNVEVVAHSLLKNFQHLVVKASQDKTDRKEPVADIKRKLLTWQTGNGSVGRVYKQKDDGSYEQVCAMSDQLGERDYVVVVRETKMSIVNFMIEGVNAVHECYSPKHIMKSELQLGQPWKGMNKATDSGCLAADTEIPLDAFKYAAQEMLKSFEGLIEASLKSKKPFKSTYNKAGKETTPKQKGMRYIGGRIRAFLKQEVEEKMHFQPTKTEFKSRAQGICKEIANILERDDLYKHDYQTILKEWKEKQHNTPQEKRAGLPVPPEVKLVNLIKKMVKITNKLGSQLNHIKTMAQSMSAEKRKEELAPAVREFAGFANYFEKEDKCNFIPSIFEMMRNAIYDVTDIKPQFLPRVAGWNLKKRSNSSVMDSAHYRTHKEDAIIDILNIYGGDTGINMLRHIFNDNWRVMKNYCRKMTMINSAIIAGSPEVGKWYALCVRPPQQHPDFGYLIDPRYDETRNTLQSMFGVAPRTATVRGTFPNSGIVQKNDGNVFFATLKKCEDHPLLTKTDAWVRVEHDGNGFTFPGIEAPDFLNIARKTTGKVAYAKPGSLTGTVVSESGRLYYISDIRTELNKLNNIRGSKTSLSIMAMNLCADTDAAVGNDANTTFIAKVREMARKWNVRFESPQEADENTPLFKKFEVAVPILNVRTLNQLPITARNKPYEDTAGTYQQFQTEFEAEARRMRDEMQEDFPEAEGETPRKKEKKDKKGKKSTARAKAVEKLTEAWKTGDLSKFMDTARDFAKVTIDYMALLNLEGKKLSDERTFQKQLKKVLDQFIMPL